MKQAKKRKRIVWQQILIWVLFAAIMIGVGIVGTSIMANGPKVHTVCILIALFVLAYFGGMAHSYVDWKLSVGQEQEKAED